MAASTQNENLAQPLSEANIDFAERLESLKAGSVGGLTIALTFGLAALIHQGLASRVAEFTALQTFTTVPSVLISAAIAALAGFLFGITYRYIIRRDRNPHLKSGAVLAFGLVRGLAQVDIGLHDHYPLLPLGVLAVESVVLFAVARSVLDWTLDHRWLKPFK